MTILSKEALDKVREEQAAQDDEDAPEVNDLFRKFDEAQRQKKEKEEEYNPLAGGDFNSFDSKE